MGAEYIPPLPVPVTRLSMRHGWLCLTFLHWRYDPPVIQRLLPPGLTVETCDGSAWVGLIPFVMQVRAARGPMMPWVSTFPETNVRTYVRGSDGSSGVWFLSLDAARLGAVVVARTGYQLPYFWSAMRVVRLGGVVSYQSRRRWPGPRWADAEIAVEVGEPIAHVAALDQFLTARFRLFSAHRHGISFANAEHDPWPLRTARLLHLDQHLLTAAGLPETAETPRVAFSDGVQVRIGWPHRVGTSSA